MSIPTGAQDLTIPPASARMRRALIAVIAVAASAMALPTPPAHAQEDWPAKPVRIVVPFATGGTTDIAARIVAEQLTASLKQTFIVENKAGAGGNIAAEYVSRAKPDGHVIFVHAATAVAANMSLFAKPPVDVAKTIQIAATINRQPFMVVVDAKSPHKTLADLTKAMLAKGEKASYASAASNGTVMGELYKARTGIKAVEVVYKTAVDSLNDQLSGAVDYAMHDPVYALAQQREGRLRILGVSSGTRLDAIPDLPTMREQGVDMDLVGWWAAMVPVGTPKPIIDQINKWFVEVVSSAETKAFLNKFGGDPFIITPEKGQELLLKDIENWRGYVEIAKIQPQG